MKPDDKPLVSILIANFNNGTFIEETLRSAVSQTYPNVEIIVVDDASSDSSVEVIEKFIKTHPNANIKLFKNELTYGCGGNKRKCIDLAVGSFFAFLDPEDTIEPEAISELMHIHLQNPLKYSIVYSTHYLCNENLEIKTISDWPGEIPEGHSHLTSTHGHISAFAVCNKQFYNQTSGINPKYIVAEDMDLYLKMEEVAPVYFVNKALYYYRKHDHNLSWNYNLRYRNLYWRHQAEKEAYRRRKKNNTIANNLSFIQWHQREFAFNMQYAKWYRMQKKQIKAFGYNIKALVYAYIFLIK
ncbi:MAG: glycosyltransferase family 2 protein [Microbacter sp.]